MKIKEYLRGFLLYFVVTFVVSAVVSYLYSLAFHGEGVVDWESSIRFGIILGIALPIVSVLGSKKQ